MPHIDSEFTDDDLDGAVEGLRECLRDLERVVDRPSALAVRARCAVRMKKTVETFSELREEYDSAIAERRELREKVGELEEKVGTAEADALLFWRLRELLEDVPRGLLTLGELREYAKDGRLLTRGAAR